jgi:hypothetical protein
MSSGGRPLVNAGDRGEEIPLGVCLPRVDDAHDCQRPGPQRSLSAAPRSVLDDNQRVLNINQPKGPIFR